MPGNRQVFSAAMNAADRLRWDSQWTEAAKEYQRSLAEFPDDTGARGGLGFCYMQTRQWKQALDEYERVLKQDPSDIIPLSKAAELYVILERRDDAYKAYLHLADLYSQAGKGSRAEAMWQKAAQLSATSPEPHERLATYYMDKKDYTAMVQERLAAAQGYLLRNDSLAARIQCEEALRVDAANAQAQQLLSRLNGQAPGNPTAMQPAQPSASTAEDGAADMVSLSNLSGGNTGMMGNMGSAGKMNGGGNPGPALAAAGTAGGGTPPTPRKRITASQVAGVLRQAQTFQSQGRFTDAIDLCEQIIESGFDRPDARYFLGWLYQEQRRWDDAIRQFQALLNDPDYALSCYYALGQCCRAKGDLRTATVNFDEAVDRVNLDALTAEESDQLVQLCQEAAEAHRMLGEQEQALTVYNALLGFLRNRGWNDKVAQVEFMLKQAQNTPAPRPASTPPPTARQGDATRVLPPEQVTLAQQQPMAPGAANGAGAQDDATMLFSRDAKAPAQKPPSAPLPPTPSSALGELPGWLTGILNEADKTQIANKQAAQPVPPAPTFPPVAPPAVQPSVANQPTTAQPLMPAANAQDASASATWLIEGAPSAPPVAPTQAANTTQILPPEQMLAVPAPQAGVAPAAPAQAEPTMVPPAGQAASPEQAAPFAPTTAVQNAPTLMPVPLPVPAAEPQALAPAPSTMSPVMQPPLTPSAEEMLKEMAGISSRDGFLKNVADSLLSSTANLPEQVRVQVLQSMQDIQRYIDHGLLTPATEECLKIISIAPQYLDIHQVLCEIYVRQGKVEQAVTKYGILIDTYVVNGRIDDAIATYRRILQLEPNNLTYRVRLINLLATHGSKEDLLRERSLAAESYLRLGYMDRALTELEQALQESPTSVPTRLNYALALQKLGHTQQAIAEYQRVLQVDPLNITALVRWHVAMITGVSANRATTLEILSRIRWQLRGEGQKHYEAVTREYNAAAETYPNNFDVRFAQGQLHQQAGNYDQAIDAYQFAMRDSSYEVMARASAAQCLLAQGKPEAAIQQLEQALQSVRNNARGAIDPMVWAARPREDGEEHQAPEVEISILLAKAYGRIGKQEQMQEILRQLKQGTTHQDEVTSTLAEISVRQGDLNGALQEYAELAKRYRDKRQVENAMSVLREMLRIAPQDPRAHSALADIHIARGELEDGLAELRLLADIALRDGDMAQAGETLSRIANIYGELGNTDDAFLYYRRAVELLPGNMDLLREVVSFCWQASRNREAIRYQEIIAHHYFETRQIKESVAALQQLIALDRTNSEAYDMLGQTYQSVGEYEQANRVYKNLAKVDPKSTIAKERLAGLRELRAKTV
jgi:tetratricopeptide (TPR) repeat protein